MIVFDVFNLQQFHTEAPIKVEIWPTENDEKKQDYLAMCCNTCTIYPVFYPWIDVFKCIPAPLSVYVLILASWTCQESRNIYSYPLVI